MSYLWNQANNTCILKTPQLIPYAKPLSGLISWIKTIRKVLRVFIFPHNLLSKNLLSRKVLRVFIFPHNLLSKYQKIKHRYDKSLYF